VLRAQPFSAFPSLSLPSFRINNFDTISWLSFSE
jgi:hypothetical protein